MPHPQRTVSKDLQRPRKKELAASSASKAAAKHASKEPQQSRAVTGPQATQAALPKARPGDGLFSVSLQRADGGSLGVDVLYKASAFDHGIVVDTVLPDGAVAAWNARTPEPFRLGRGDRILRVNAVDGSVEAMISELETASRLNLLAQHYVQPTSAADGLLLH